MPAYPSPGESIGRFRVLSRLGEGGMGVVFEALEVTLERTVALKVIAPAFADDPAFRERFAREARAMAALDSQHVVKVYAHGEDDGYLYIATQLIPDGDLGQLLETVGPPSLGDALDLVAQVAGGLADAHAKGLVHRDIKPGNVLLRRHASGHAQAYLADFGIARRVDADQTQLGSGVVGTPAYLAPELYRGVPASPSSDVYALGCLLWTTLVGRPPHDGVPPAEVIDGVETRDAPEVHDDTPLALETNRILATALADDPEARIDVETLRDDLAAAARMSDDPAFGRRAGTSGETATFVPDQPTSERVPGARAVAPAAGAPSAESADSAESDQSAQRAPQPAHTPGPAGRPRWLALAAAAVVGVLVGGAATYAVVDRDDGADSADDLDPAASSQVQLTADEQEFVDQDPAAILEQMERDMAVLDSVRLRRASTDEEAVGFVGFDVLATDRGNCEGTLSTFDGRSRVRRYDGTTFVAPDIQFLQSVPIYGKSDTETLTRILSRAAGRWLVAGAKLSGTATTLCEIERQRTLKVGPGNGISPEGAAKGDLTDVDGRRAISINATFTEDGENPTNATATIAVAAPHHLLTIEFGDEIYSYSEFDVPLRDADLYLLPSDTIGIDEALGRTPRAR